METEVVDVKEAQAHFTELVNRVAAGRGSFCRKTISLWPNYCR